MMASSSPKPVSVSYHDLVNNAPALRGEIEQAFGSNEGSLGIILISGLPAEYHQIREKLFFLAHRLAGLPTETLDALSRPQASYSFGWSHGKEIMNGMPDTQKGSFYANPLVDSPAVSDDLRSQHPEYYDGNVWPSDVAGLEEFESTFKAMGKLIFDVGCALARACEAFVAAHTTNSQTPSLEGLISQSQCNKARLLHYYPVPPSETHGSSDAANDALCGTHLDHSILTGLCSAMYLSSSSSTPDQARVVSAPTSSSGLYIYPRTTSSKGSPVKVSIPQDCLAFQTGEALQLLTGGKLAATPHFVSGNAATNNNSDESVSRETFAFFLQPDVDAVIAPDGETFGGFTKRVLSRHYSESK